MSPTLVSRPRLQIGTARRNHGNALRTALELGAEPAFEQEKDMPSTKRRTYPQETIDAIAQRFDAAPPASQTRTELGAPAVVRALLPKLRQMIEKGYSWQAIASLMADCGVTLGPSVLRKYAAAKPYNAKAKKRTGGGASSRSSQPYAVPMAARVPTARGAEGVTPPEDAWEDIESIGETDRAPADSPPGASFLNTPSVLQSEAEKVAGASAIRSSSLRTRSDAERR
jgi:hypothetical protein